MISPTGQGIRIDSEGSGILGAPRGLKKHKGVDYECVAGQDVCAPFDMTILRVARPYAKGGMSGIAWRSGKSTGKMFYLEPNLSLVGQRVGAGEVIGRAQSISEFYNLPMMKDHIHFEVD